jgi:hypothetical protein
MSLFKLKTGPIDPTPAADTKESRTYGGVITTEELGQHLLNT